MSPDGSTKPSPEEKLLKLIREKGAKPSPAGSSAASPSAGTAASVVLVRDVSTRSQPWPWPSLAIGGLSVVLMVEIVSLVIQVMRPAPTVRIPTVGTVFPREPVSVTAAPPEMPSLVTSVTRPLFTPPADLTASTVSTPKSGPSASAKLLATRLTLMGIVSGNPSQAIIEDAQTKKTFFVSKGQAVSDGAVLDQVLDNRVILDLDGEKIELTL